MSKTHVPGPWKLQDLGPKPGYPDWKSYAVRSEMTNVCIATVGYVDRYYEGKEEANAKLICAAPDLLNALELALATIQRLSHPKPYDHTQGTRDVITAAISKAIT
jgi:hypothetical protein